MRLSLRVAASLAVLAFASPAEGQARATTGRQFHVTPRGGYIAFDKASGLDNAAVIGLDAGYGITSMFTLGASASFSRPVTNGDDFLGAIYLGDTTFIYRAQQPITMANVQLAATVKLPLVSRLAPYLFGGVGGYTLYLDPQVSGRDNRVQRMSLGLGGGVEYRMSDRIGIALDVRDLIFMNYDRERLNPVNSAGRLARFIEDFPTPPENKKTVHNIALQLGFTFVPTLGSDEEGR